MLGSQLGAHTMTSALWAFPFSRSSPTSSKPVDIQAVSDHDRKLAVLKLIRQVAGEASEGGDLETLWEHLG